MHSRSCCLLQAVSFGRTSRFLLHSLWVGIYLNVLILYDGQIHGHLCSHLFLVVVCHQDVIAAVVVVVVIVVVIGVDVGTSNEL